MTDPESILQLGIEAAREGNNEEARSLFRLLTKENPDNVRGWFWLAGVAENREERQMALEKVLELEPGNELALQSLNAMGARPTTRLPEEEGAEPATPPPSDVATAPPEAPQAEADPFGGDEDPFAELDGLSDVFSESPGAVRRAEEEQSKAEAAAAPVQEDPHADQVSTFREKPAKPSGNRFDQRQETEEDVMAEPQHEDKRRLSPLAIGLTALVAIIALAIFLNVPARIAGMFGSDQQPAAQGPIDQPTEETDSQTTAPTEDEQPTPEPGSETEQPADSAEQPAPEPGSETEQPADSAEQPAPEPGSETEQPAENQDDVLGTDEEETPEATPATEPTPAEPPSPAPAPEPTAAPAPTPEPVAPADQGELAQANPAIVPANTPLQANNWTYDFATPAYATFIAGNFGPLQPQQGRTVIVLVYVENNTGQAQRVPDDFFILKDAQGRIYYPQPQASTMYLNMYGGRSVAGDLSQEDAIPANGLTYSMPLVFDVPPDATDLVLFSSRNMDQGWLVLQDLN